MEQTFSFTKHELSFLEDATNNLELELQLAYKT